MLLHCTINCETILKCHCHFLLDDLELVGSLLSEYWELKKIMAPGCESAAVASMMSALAPYVCGMSLAGAGGGGFMYVITKEPNDKQRIQNVLSDVKVCWKKKFKLLFDHNLFMCF